MRRHGHLINYTRTLDGTSSTEQGWHTNPFSEVTLTRDSFRPSMRRVMAETFSPYQNASEGVSHQDLVQDKSTESLQTCQSTQQSS